MIFCTVKASLVKVNNLLAARLKFRMLFGKNLKHRYKQKCIFVALDRIGIGIVKRMMILTERMFRNEKTILKLLTNFRYWKTNLLFLCCEPFFAKNEVKNYHKVLTKKLNYIRVWQKWSETFCLTTMSLNIVRYVHALLGYRLIDPFILSDACSVYVSLYGAAISTFVKLNDFVDTT